MITAAAPLAQGNLSKRAVDSLPSQCTQNMLQCVTTLRYARGTPTKTCVPAADSLAFVAARARTPHKMDVHGAAPPSPQKK